MDDDAAMWIEANLKLSFYQPEEIEIGMWFINSLYPGTDREFVEVWELTELPDEEIDSFFLKTGFPVHLIVTIENSNPDELDDVLSFPEDLGFLFNPETELLEELNIKHVNTIIKDYQGEVFLFVNEFEYMYNDVIVPELTNDQLMILCYPFDEDYEEEFED